MGRGRDSPVITLLAPAGALVAGAEFQLEPEERHHLRVRRARSGDSVRLLDGRGTVAGGQVLEPDDGRIRLNSVEHHPAPVQLGLAVGAGDRDRFAWLVEKAAELGASDLIPLETERTVGVSSRVRGDHIEKLQRRALEAIKQSGAAWVPTIHLPHTLAELVARHRSGVRWLADREGRRPEPPDPQAPVWIAVGPEGGFTDGERRGLLDEGWVGIRLSGQVLRFETAAVAAAALAGLDR